MEPASRWQLPKPKPEPIGLAILDGAAADGTVADRPAAGRHAADPHADATADHAARADAESNQDAVAVALTCSLSRSGL